MRGQAVIDAALHQDLHQLDVVGIDVGLSRESDLRRFFVSAFAEANADTFGQELLDVALGALQVRLNHGADGIRVSRHTMQFVNEIKSALRVGRTLHVDAHKARRIP